MDKDLKKFLSEMEKMLGNLDDIDEIGDFYDHGDKDFDDLFDEEFDQFEFAGISDGNLDALHNESFDRCKDSPPDSFDGYTLVDIKNLIYTPFSEESTLKINTLEEEDFAQIPMLNQVRHLMSYMTKRKQIKLSQVGYLPLKIVRELCEISVDDFLIKYKKRIIEKDSYEVETTRTLATQMGVCKEEKGKISLTQKGESLLNNPQKLLEELLISFTTKVIISRFDCFECDIRIGQFAPAFSLILVAKYGDRKRDYSFYAKKYFKAFSFLQDDISDKDTEYYAYNVRIFERFMLQLGIIEPKEVSTRHYQIKKTALFDKIFSLV